MDDLSRIGSVQERCRNLRGRSKHDSGDYSKLSNPQDRQRWHAFRLASHLALGRALLFTLRLVASLFDVHAPQ